MLAFPDPSLYKSWMEGRSDLIIRCSLDRSCLVDDPNHTEMDEDRTDWMMAVEKMTSSSWGRLDPLSCLSKFSLGLAFGTSSGSEKGWFLEIRRDPQYSVVEDGERRQSRESSSDVHRHVHCLEQVKFQVVLTTPVYQPFHLLPVCTLITVLDQNRNSGVICKLHEFHQRVR
ncbi:hypothetical protein AMECASPLE_027317 [Ameca splendens]|uniref:Uncharacterized protein n=1 Tax=Ameca splendens TaxID=208324 RepID=A0ABV0XU50_9TELE